MTNLLRNAVREMIPSLSDAEDEEIDELIDENKENIALIIYNSYSKNIISVNDDVTWSRRSKLVLDYYGSLEENVIDGLTSTCKTCQAKYAEAGDTAIADKFTGIIEGIAKSSAGTQKNIGYATNELIGKIVKGKDFERENAETMRKMEEDLQ
jgi:hypothetical protein